MAVAAVCFGLLVHILQGMQSEITLRASIERGERKTMLDRLIPVSEDIRASTLSSALELELALALGALALALGALALALGLGLVLEIPPAVTVPVPPAAAAAAAAVA